MKLSVTASFVLVALALQSQSTDAHRIRKESFAPQISQRFVHGIHKGLNLLKNSVFDTWKWSSGKPRPNAAIGMDLVADGEEEFAYLTQASSDAPLTIAQRFIESQLGLQAESDYVVKDQYTTKHNGVTHIYLKQMVNGLAVENGDVNINIDRQGRVVSFGESTYGGGKGVKSSPGFVLQNDGGNDYVAAAEESYITAEPKISATQAVASLANYLSLPVPPEHQQLVKTVNSLNGEPEQVVLGFNFTLKNGIPIKNKYLRVQSDDGKDSLVLVYDIQVEMEENWYHAHVNAEDGKVIALVDWVSDATYEVYPVGVNDPHDGERVVLKDPAKLASEASPLGWHAQGEDESDRFTTTAGNNVYAQENLDGKTSGEINNYRPDGGEDLDFRSKVDLKKSPKTYLDAAIINLFYMNNVMHDLPYVYGYDEQSGNFQQNNFGRGGQDGDAVMANAQDGAGMNNANFATPPDGQTPKMRMYVWNTAKPYRDGDFDNAIIIHEYTHGISTRLTGGPSNSGCLGWGEAGGMGEGYGDFMSLILRQREHYNRTMDFPMGAYASNRPKGIRKFVYSTNMTTNPSTYAYTRKFAYIGVHAKGEVFAAMLNEMYWNLVEEFGFSNNLYDPLSTDKTRKIDHPAGNVMALQLLIDSMKLQPCRPSFVDARDALLQADQVNYDGKAACAIWRGFAKRGLGMKARPGGREDFSLPAKCKN
ncbi:hypothetical protein MP228_006880 [Amoeboaphelidium protococcarum]|nr:hypothetical protein MP228_006880 [Amoeboaphelidium protococcarum]